MSQLTLNFAWQTLNIVRTAKHRNCPDAKCRTFNAYCRTKMRTAKCRNVNVICRTPLEVWKHITCGNGPVIKLMMLVLLWLMMNINIIIIIIIAFVVIIIIVVVAIISIILIANIIIIIMIIIIIIITRYKRKIILGREHDWLFLYFRPC